MVDSIVANLERKYLCQVMKLLISILVRSLDGHMSGYTGCSAGFMEGMHIFKV